MCVDIMAGNYLACVCVDVLASCRVVNEWMSVAGTSVRALRHVCIERGERVVYRGKL